MERITLAVIAVFSTAALPLPVAAEEETGCCPRCRARCIHTVEKDQVSRECFRVECQWICVPRIRFPWEPCCQSKGAYLRKVKVLKTVEYECEECRHTWKAVCTCPPCGAPSGDARDEQPALFEAPRQPATSRPVIPLYVPPVR